jgi:hypothetical protein
LLGPQPSAAAAGGVNAIIDPTANAAIAPNMEAVLIMVFSFQCHLESSRNQGGSIDGGEIGWECRPHKYEFDMRLSGIAMGRSYLCHSDPQSDRRRR